MSTSEKERSPHANRIRLGKLLEEYNGRILGGIRMSIDKSSGKPNTYKYAFVKLEDEPSFIVKYPHYRPPGWEEILRSKQPTGWEKVIKDEQLRRQKEQEDSASRAAAHPATPGEPVSGEAGLVGGSGGSEGQFPRGSDAKLNKYAPRRTQNARRGEELFNSESPALGKRPPEPPEPPTLNVYGGEEFSNFAPGLTANQPPEPPNAPIQAPEVSFGISKNYASPCITEFAQFLALDIETCAEPKIGRKGRIASTADALDPRRAEIRLVSLADSDGNISLLDLRELGKLPDHIAGALERHTLVVHNAAFELLFLETKFSILPERIFCTLTASRLLDPQKSVPHSLGPVIERYLDVKLSKEHGGGDWGAMMLTAGQLEYARDDVRYLLRLREILEAKLEEAGLMDVFALETALLPIIARMELHGFAVDTDRLASMLSEVQKRAGALEEEIRRAFGEEKLNPASPEQLVVAFKKAGVELENTEEKTLCALPDERAALILEYRCAAKLASSIEGLLEAQCEGRIFARFNPLGAVTGRFSSKGPNLQNITRGPLRSCFIPSAPERRLIIADYSQIELRIAALVAGETVMVEAFRRREDLHYKIAAVNLGKPLSEVTRAERGSVGKSTNFGFIYGQGAQGFMVYARTGYGLVIELEQAVLFRNNFFETYPALRAWHEHCWRKAKDGMAQVRTIYGRLLRAQADTPWARFNLWTEYIVSGSCADLLKAAMVRIASILPTDVHLIATVHDELIYDAPLDLAEQYCGMIRLAMEEVFVEMFGTTVPIEVESKVCANWGRNKAVPLPQIAQAPDSSAPESRLPGLRGLSGLADCKPVIVIDSREQDPLHFTRLQAVSGALYSGDYSVAGLEDSFAIERKSVDDLVACCLATQRERFEHELHRLRGYRFKRLLIVGSREDIAASRYRSRINPKSVLATLGAFEARYDLPLIFAASPQEAAALIERWVFWFAREMVEAANNLLRGCTKQESGERA